MALAFIDVTAPVSANHPMPNLRTPFANYSYAMRVYYDDSWGVPSANGRPLLFHFHGSGAAGPLTGVLLDRLIAKGWNVISCQGFGVGLSSESPFRYGYGNVSAPHFLALFIKLAWWVYTCVGRGIALYPGRNITLLGHSMGASACMAYNANYHCQGLHAMRGMVINAATVAGLGTGTWNDIWRNIATMIPIFNLASIRTIASYADDDLYAPPDYSRRIQLGLPTNSPVYMVSPGVGGHGWMSASVANADLAANWCEQIMTGAVIRDRFNQIAIPGPVAY